MRVDHDRGLGTGHVGPAFEHRVVLVDHSADHSADVERLLAIAVALLGEDVADRGEIARRMHVRVDADVAVDRVGGLRVAREALARRDVGVLVVLEEHLAGRGQVRRPVLRLAVGAHHAVVTADTEVVLGRDATGVVQRLLAGQHHRAVRGHHEDALGVHEHRRFGVPVRLGADIDARDDDVDLAAALGERDDPTQGPRDPVHVLGAGVHRDRRTRGEGEPLDRYAEFLGEVDAGDDARALGLRDRAEGLGRVTEERDPGHALGVTRGRGADQADDQAGLVTSERPVDRDELAGVVEVVFGERCPPRRSGSGSVRTGTPCRGRGSAGPSGCTRRADASARSAAR